MGCDRCSAKTEVSVVVLSSLQRVLQDEVDVDGAQEAEVFCAKGGKRVISDNGA